MGWFFLGFLYLGFIISGNKYIKLNNFMGIAQLI